MMHVRAWGTHLVVILAATVASAQSALPTASTDGNSGPVDRDQSAESGASPLRSSSPAATDGVSGTITRVSASHNVLPNQHGQVWREYDISPYTSQFDSTKRPQQAIVDWILRETGTDAWFTEPLGLLNASRTTLRVYHIPQMQRIVSDVVDRFLSRDAGSQVFTMRVVTIGSPKWRAKAQGMLRPVSVQTPGTEAWLLSKEDAAVLITDLRRRIDYREHHAPNLFIYNGQQERITSTRPREYVRSVKRRPDMWPGYELEISRLEEGFVLELSPLLSQDGTTIDAVIKCQVDQVEKLESVTIEVPVPGVRGQKVQIQVPHMSGWRLHERFRWPVDQVLLVSRGVVAIPTPGKPGRLAVSNPIGRGPPRADSLLFVESKGTIRGRHGTDDRAPRTGSVRFGGRY